jgi:hypothetical protein
MSTRVITTTIEPGLSELQRRRAEWERTERRFERAFAEDFGFELIHAEPADEDRRELSHLDRAIEAQAQELARFIGVSRGELL